MSHPVGSRQVKGSKQGARIGKRAVPEVVEQRKDKATASRSAAAVPSRPREAARAGSKAVSGPGAEIVRKPVTAARGRPEAKARGAKRVASEDEESSSEEEEAVAQAVKRQVVAAAKRGGSRKGATDESDDESEDESENEEASSQGEASDASSAEISELSDSDVSEGDDASSAEEGVKRVVKPAAKKGGATKVLRATTSVCSDDELSEEPSDDEDSSSEEPPRKRAAAAKPKAAAVNKAQVKAPAKAVEEEDDGASSSSEDEEEASAESDASEISSDADEASAESDASEDTSSVEFVDAKKGAKGGAAAAAASPDKKATPKRTRATEEEVLSPEAKRVRNDASSAEAASGSPEVFVRNLPWSVKESDIYQFFGECGKIENIHWVSNRETGRFSGSIFMRFATQAGADAAITKNGADFSGREVEVKASFRRPDQMDNNSRRNNFQGAGDGPNMRSRGPQQHQVPQGRQQGKWGQNRSEDRTVFIGNLNKSVTDDSIGELFSKCGQIKEIRWVTREGEFKGCGFIQFDDPEAVKRAIKINGQSFMGKPIRVDFASRGK